MESIQSLIAIILGVISIIGVIGGLAYWKGTVDSIVKEVKDIPERTKALEMKMDVIWALFVDKVLDGKPLLATRGSGYKLTPEGERCVNGMLQVIEEVRRENPSIAPSDALTLITQKMGLQELQRIAHENQCNLPEFFSLLTIKLGIPV